MLQSSPLAAFRRNYSEAAKKNNISNIIDIPDGVDGVVSLIA
ncbi:MAG TPA: hypothetical protein VEL11_18165 [Candidatus Bathyarchaeia archaeon]|nr:hypothetical protein [Candidatus Bathyarchaeia archaeon]